MTEVSATQVRKLRESSGAGIMDCKKALIEAEGSMEDALALLRLWGRSDAQELEDREASEGRIIIWSENTEKGSSVSMVEVNCETDFVARNDEFISVVDEFPKTLMSRASKAGTKGLDVTLEALFEGEVIKLSAKMGERVLVKRASTLSSIDAVIGTYVHPGNQIVSFVCLQREDDLLLEDWDPEVHEQYVEVANDLAMHVAAMSPTYVDYSEILEEDLEWQEDEFRAQALENGKPEHIVPRIIEGKIAKWKNEQTLVGQPFVKNPDIAVGQWLENELEGTEPKIASFVRYEINSN